MSEMINRVAEQLCYSKPVTFEEMARVAIAAMREPTEEMIKEGNRSTTDGRGAEDSWPAMIDEALK